MAQKHKYITVTAPPGRLTPIHEGDGVDPGGAQLRVDHEHVCRVRLSQTVLRAINRGDLKPCTLDGTHVAAVADAIAPDTMEHHKIRLAQKKPAPSVPPAHEGSKP
jgi:hypothetical protein